MYAYGDIQCVFVFVFMCVCVWMLDTFNIYYLFSYPSVRVYVSKIS